MFAKKLLNLRALGALPPDPLAFGSWGRWPQTPNGFVELNMPYLIDSSFVVIF